MGTAPSGTETLIASPRLPKTIVVLSCTAITGTAITGNAVTGNGVAAALT